MSVLFFKVYRTEKGSDIHQGHNTTHKNALDSHESLIKYVRVAV